MQVLQSVVNAAQQVGDKLNTDWKYVLAQWYQEEGTYLSDPNAIKSLGYNLAGITDPNGTYRTGTMDSNVYANYNSLSSFANDDASVLSQYVQNAQSISQYANNLQAGGYATDPNYANKIIGVYNSMNTYGLNIIPDTTPLQTGTVNSNTNPLNSITNLQNGFQNSLQNYLNPNQQSPQNYTNTVTSNNPLDAVGKFFGGIYSFFTGGITNTVSTFIIILVIIVLIILLIKTF